MEKIIQQEVSDRKAYARPQLVKQGRVEDVTRDVLEHIGDNLDCSKPVQ